MSTELAPQNGHHTAPPKAIEEALVAGNLNQLGSDQRIAYYNATCESLGLNPYTRPFEYITLNGKLTLYATRACTEQLRASRKVSLTIVGREKVGDVYVVTARATTPDGRSDESTGVVALGRLTGDALANALMKAETKAKRRVTLSICGLGWLDESETETIPGARLGEPAPVAPLTLEDGGVRPAVVDVDVHAEPPIDDNPWNHRIESERAKVRGLALHELPDDVWAKIEANFAKATQHLSPADQAAIAAAVSNPHLRPEV